MGRLIYTALCSLDGYVEDAAGDFSWAAPDEEVHFAVNALERPIGTYLYGRRMYETMRVWQDTDSRRDSDAVAEYGAIWRSADKVVFSRTIDSVSTPSTTLEREFDPQRVAALKAASEQDLSIGGAELAGQAFAAGLVDVCHLFVTPVAVGAGKSALIARQPVGLELVDVQPFRTGTVHLHYRVS